MMNIRDEKKTVDWSVIAVGCAAAIFIGVLFILLGGWAFMWAWNIFIVPVFAMPVIDIWMGWGALVLLYLTGYALGFRKSSTRMS